MVWGLGIKLHFKKRFNQTISARVLFTLKYGELNVLFHEINKSG